MMVAPKLRFKADDGSEFPAWEKKTLRDIVERVTRKNRDNQTDVPLTISSLDGLVDQRDYFKKTVASKDMSGYFLLQNGEFAITRVIQSDLITAPSSDWTSVRVALCLRFIFASV